MEGEGAAGRARIHGWITGVVFGLQRVRRAKGPLCSVEAPGAPGTDWWGVRHPEALPQVGLPPRRVTSGVPARGVDEEHVCSLAARATGAARGRLRVERRPLRREGGEYLPRVL